MSVKLISVLKRIRMAYKGVRICQISVGEERSGKTGFFSNENCIN